MLAKDEKSGDRHWKPVLNHYWNRYEKTVYISIEDVEGGAGHTIVSNTIHSFFAVRESLHSASIVKVAYDPRAALLEPTEYTGSIPNGAWIEAAELESGDRLLNADESWSVVTEVQIVNDELKAFNLNVADYDSFYVRGAGSKSSAGVWVHNCNDGVTNKPPASAPTGRSGSPLENLEVTPTRNSDEIIGGRRYTGHSLDQAQNRGLTPTVVEDAIQNGTRSADPIRGRVRNYSSENNITVITEGNDVVTVIPGKR